MANGGEDHSGAISPAGRFARMEASLERIEEKLDETATSAELTVLSGRVAALEVVEQDRVSKAEAIKETAAVTANAVQMQSDARYRVTQVVLSVVSLIVVILGTIRFADMLQSL